MIAPPDACGGMLYIRYTIKDDCNNTDTSCTSIFTVVGDEEDPEITDIADFSLTQCNEPWPETLKSTWKDNCDGEGEIDSDNGIDLPPSEDGCTQYRLYTFTYTDTCGNTATETTTVARTFDVTPPELTIPEDFTIECDQEIPECDPTDATASDNCSEVTITCEQSEPIPDEEDPCLYTVTNTYTATDFCGNATTKVQTITIYDNTPPELTIPEDFTIECDQEIPECDPTDATASDNCSEVTITCEQSEPIPDEVRSVSVYCYQYLYCHRTSAVTLQPRCKPITIYDYTPPELTIPEDFTIECDQEIPECDPTDATASDNCSEVTITCEQSEPMPDEEDPCLYTVTNTYTATDFCGNATTKVQTITIYDYTPPELTIPEDFTIECDQEIPECDPTDATASDNCSEVTITCEQSEPIPDEEDPCLYTVTNTYTATDFLR